MDNENKSGVSAPWHLWVIAILLVLWNGLGVFDYMATVLRYEPYLSGFPEDALDYYFSAPLWMYAMWGIGSFGGLATAILLLMRNKLAVPIYGASLACSIVAVIYGIVNPAPGGASNVVFPAIVILIASLLLLYAIWLKRRGVLR